MTFEVSPVSLGELAELGATAGKVNDMESIYVTGRYWLNVLEEDKDAGTARGAVFEMRIFTRDRRFTPQDFVPSAAMRQLFVLSDVTLTTEPVTYGWKSDGKGSWEGVVVKGPAAVLRASSEKYVDHVPVAEDTHDLPSYVQTYRAIARPADGVMSPDKVKQVIEAFGKLGDGPEGALHEWRQSSGIQYAYTDATLVVKRVDPPSNAGMWIGLGVLGLAAAYAYRKRGIG